MLLRKFLGALCAGIRAVIDTEYRSRVFAEIENEEDVRMQLGL